MKTLSLLVLALFVLITGFGCVGYVGPDRDGYRDRDGREHRDDRDRRDYRDDRGHGDDHDRSGAPGRY